MKRIDKTKELMVMKLLHYFITEKNYSPVIVHGVQDEIWLENMNAEYRIVRIVMGYIHNDEQFEFDSFKVSRLVSQIKLKTFTLKMKTLSFYLDVNDDVELKNSKNNFTVKVSKESDIINNDLVKTTFPDIKEKLVFTEEGETLYERINDDIMIKNISETNKINDLFSIKKPIVTNVLIGIMSIIMLLMYIIGNGSTDINTLVSFGALINDGNPIRIITSMFLHIGFIHFFMNMWALEIIGKEVESFYGHIKTLIIFIFSGIIGNLLSLLFASKVSLSAGASGAIFGLMGALLYFGLNERTYMGEALKKEILPVIIINLVFGMMIPSINMYAHIGGLIGGIIISIALGIKYKSSKVEKINGWIASVLLILGLVYLVYFV